MNHSPPPPPPPTIMPLRFQFPKPPTGYTLGLFYILLVATIWSLSSYVVQSIVYEQEEYKEPFILTYLCMVLFVLLMPMEEMKAFWRGVGVLLMNIRYWRVLLRPFNDSAVVEHGEGGVKTTVKKQKIGSSYESINSDSEVPNALSPSTSSSSKSGQGTYLSLTSNDVEAPKPSLLQSPSTLSSSSPLPSNPLPPTQTQLFSKSYYVTLGLLPLWFAANYLYNLSLSLTSISSSTVLATTSSIFTYLFSTHILKCEDEGRVLFKIGKVGISLKLIGVAFTVMGGCIVTFADAHHESSVGDVEGEGGGRLAYRIIGDICGLCSAVGYGAYTTYVKFYIPDNDMHVEDILAEESDDVPMVVVEKKDAEKINMRVVFGYLGLLSLIILTLIVYPILYMLNLAPPLFKQGEALGGITLKIILTLLLKGLFDNLLSDYIWARSIILTSPTVATVGLSLTVPVAFLIDLVTGKLVQFDEEGEVVWGGIVQKGFGGCFVLVGFVMVNLK